ncbi:hypothetical protein BDV25DRAFT_160873 [Aspergillus avenaceus]|uniref:Uncharacterized protein n=1 Tax=Aspergillus avenaceus TaxID=36643 RepID=A0A5N6TLG3_ASPAV|nr:hypothetical protein BDV25DRAFT_160873 [Aspergillus avenaceus]
MVKPPTLRPQSVARINHLIKHWPSDLVRPSSVSVQSYLQSRLPQSPEDASKQSQSQKSPQSQGEPISEASLNALSSLLEDRYARRYPMSPKIRRPASIPDHYDNVIKEFSEAPTRDWMGRVTKRLKGLFRFS